MSFKSSFKSSALENLTLKELNTLLKTEFERHLVEEEIDLRAKCGVKNWWKPRNSLKQKRIKTGFEKFKKEEIKQIVHLLGSTYFCGTELLERHCAETWNIMKKEEPKEVKKYKKEAVEDKKRFFFEKKIFTVLNK